MNNKLLGMSIICFGFAEWDNPYKTNQHHLMQRFSADNKVLFIESLGLRQPTVQGKDIKRMARRVVKWLKGVRRVSPSLFVFAPLVIPLHKYAVVRSFNRVFLRWQLRRVVRSLEFVRPIVWSYVPNAVEYLGMFNERLSVYHCVDELSANPLVPKKAIQAMEREFLARVDIVFTTARNLYETKRPFNTHTYYMPNVADFDHFHAAYDPAPPRHDTDRKPVIGFIGAVSEYKLDFELLSRLAGRHPGWTIRLVGPTGEGEKVADLSCVKVHPNIELLGGKPYRDLPSYLRAFDVCLLPNRLNEYTKNMFPMKFFEYLSSGKPVVAVRLDALADFADVCYLSSTHEEFERNIIVALAENDRALKERRVALARKFTWQTRMEEMSAVIAAALERSEGHHAR